MAAKHRRQHVLAFTLMIRRQSRGHRTTTAGDTSADECPSSYGPGRTQSHCAPPLAPAAGTGTRQDRQEPTRYRRTKAAARQGASEIRCITTVPGLWTQPSDPHHLRFAQPRAIGLKVSDEFTVPLCRGHHRQLHQVGDEVAWWTGKKSMRWRSPRSLEANTSLGPNQPTKRR